ncbi:MAG: plastocyanin/azurin family copper-binding protein [Actinomycetota bacterium]|jgi:uncharacterized cupredoxin-like copper-binding protein
MRRSFGFMTAVVLALVAVGCGGSDHGESHGGSTAEPSRTVDVVMKEFAYEPASVDVKAGETVKFVFRNEGKTLHDAFLGDEAAQAEHEKEMREGEDHDGHDAIKVIPGETGELTHTFDKAGEALIIGCHETGHYQAGMKMTVTVS